MKSRIGICLLACCLMGPVIAEIPPELANLADELALARQGELIETLPPWLQMHELPSDIRRELTVPPMTMQVLDGPHPYVVAGGKILRAGDSLGEHPILFIEPEGVVIEVVGYAVLLD